MSDTTWKEIIPIVSQSICSYLKIEFPTIQIHKSLSKKSTREKDTEDWNITTSFFFFFQKIPTSVAHLQQNMNIHNSLFLICSFF